MRNLTSAVTGVAALGLLFVGGSGPSRADAVVRTSPAFVTPDANRTKAYLNKLAGDGGVANWHAMLNPLNATYPPPALLANHLYDALGGRTLQFPLLDGILQPSPVATLSPALAPIAMGPHGGFYVSALVGTSYACNPQSTWSVNLYSTPDLQPLRSLSIACPSGKSWFAMNLSALGIDPQGYLYVGYAAFNYPNNSRQGIQVYAPFSSGNRLPLLDIPLVRTEATGIAFDAQGTLFVSRHHLDDVAVYANPRKNPQLVRRIYGGLLQSPGELWIDPTGELYVASLSHKSKLPYALAYHDSASGRAKPDRQISVAGTLKGADPESIAVTANYLFIVDGAHLYEVSALVNGPQQPIAQWPSGADALTVGP